MHPADHTLITDLLSVLKVPYTKQYTKQRFETMPFKTLFGVSQLLKEYGVESKGYQFEDKTKLLNLTTPFVAQTEGGLIIVTKIDKDNISYLTQGILETLPVNEFENTSTGVVLLPVVNKGAEEPEYGKHLVSAIIGTAKKVLLIVLAGLLSAYLIVVHNLWPYWSFWCLLAVDCFGIWLTYMLVQKSLSIKSHVADKVCGVLQEGGCDEILKTKASSFFGIFSWSEVGFTYFGVSLLAMLISPATIHWLSLINICCLPFTIWSISYQKFVAKHWCTLCVCVQGSLWLQFIFYLLGGWMKPVFPLDLGFFALGATFIMVLLALNQVLPNFTKKEN
ncbi:MAG: hypothetical protein J1F16_00935 [Muribaculaceae bacterium]|nr:hypothetical protein [Muribaculaceae bacterium]